MFLLLKIQLVQNIYLVCRIVRNGRMNPNDKEKNSQAIRRPFGCAVQDVSFFLFIYLFF